MKKISPSIRQLIVAGLFLIGIINEGFAQCTPPTNLHITNLTPTTASFEWNYSSHGTSYVLRVRPAGSYSWRRLPSSNNTETVISLLPNTQYEAKVRTNCGSVEGSYTSLLQFTTPSNNPCNLPNVYYFTSDNITANTCLIGWRSVTNATSYNVRYRIRYSNSAWLPGSSATNSLQLSGLNPVTQYEFQVQTVCASGTAAFSTSGIFTTHSGSCNPPVNLAANNVTTTTAQLSWSTTPCALYYIIEYRKTGLTWISDTTSSALYPVDSLIEGTTYEYRVQNVAPNGTFSSPSQPYAFATASNSCGVPANLNSNPTTNGATLTWSAVTGASSYKVRYRLAGSTSWQTITSAVVNASVSGLSPDNAYEFQVQSICGATAGSYSTLTTFITLHNISNNIPVPDHIVIVVFENKAYTQVFNSSLTPHINAFANDPNSAIFVESYGITHPSQPNYLHLFSGSSQGITTNNLITQHFNTPNLAKELLNAGRTFVSYCEGLPSVGYDGYTSGRYARKHNPVANWMGSGSNQVPATLNQPFSSFPTDFNNLPTVSLVVPNMDNSMHDGSLGTALTTGDTWFYNKLNAYIQWAKTHNSLLIFTADEDDGSHGNRILTIFNGEMVNGGSYSQPINHHDVLRTIEEMYGLNFAGASANATAIHGCWTSGFRRPAGPVVEETITAEDRSGWRIYPNPSRGELHAAYELTEDADVSIRIYNSTGAIVHEKKLGMNSKGKKIYDVPSDKRFPAGMYFIDISYGDKKFVQRFLVSE